MTKDKFFDRQSYLDTLEKRIRDLKDGYRQNIAIIGDELLGKTSIIYRFLNRFYDNQFIILYIDVRPESLITFSKRFIGMLLYNFLINSARPIREDINFLIKKSTKYIPKTVEKIKEILILLEKKNKTDIFGELLSLGELLHQETGKFCVIIFDEFHNLENIGFKNLYSEWSRILISQKHMMHIIISSLKFKAKTILSKHLSLLFGNFEIIQVEPFDVKTSNLYLENKFKENDVNLNTGLKNFLIHFTGGFPFYLEIITEAYLNNSDKIELVDVLENMLFEATGSLNQKFSNYLKRFLDSPCSQDYISIMYFISCGHNKIKDIVHLLHKPKKEVIKKINHLLELDAINRNGDFLEINDRVFSFWLKFVYQEKLQSLTFDAKNQKELFRDNINRMIQEFMLQAQKPIAERISELLRLFEDETIQLERKRLKLTRFREIKLLEFNRKNLKDGLIGRAHDALWIIAFKSDSLCEDDITEFSKECKKYRHKLQRKIIITLKDVEMNAKLRALEEKIWTWDLNNLNHLLDLFSRPRIIA
jgi:GTPase SAR1 family protein